MTYINLPVDSRNRTLIGEIIPNENWNIAQHVLEFLGHWKRVDYKNTYETERDKKPKTAERIAYLQSQGITDTVAKRIIRDNDDLNALLWRTFKANRREWHKDIAAAIKKPKNRKLQYRAAHAEKMLAHPRTVTHGGHKLWLQAQNDPAKMIEFKNRRGWLGATGRSDYMDFATGKVLNEYHSNQAIRVDEKLNVSIAVPPALQGEYGLTHKKCWVIIGSLRTKNAREILPEYNKQGRSVTYHIQWLNGKWCLRANLRLDPIIAEDDGRLVGIDINSEHVDYHILDHYGNPVGKPVTMPFKSKKDIVYLVDKLAAATAKMGVTAIGIEKLEGLQRDKARGRSRYVNGKVSRIPTGVIKRELKRQVENRGWSLIQIDAAGTSALADCWNDVVRGKDTHQIACYLIGRKALGYSIIRENHKVVKPRVDSGRSEVSLDDLLDNWLLRGENTTGEFRTANSSDPPF